MYAALVCLLLLPARAFAEDPVASTGTAAAAPVAMPAVKRVLVKIPKDAGEWEPFPVKTGGDPAKIKTLFKKAKAKAVARVHAVKGERMLVVSVYPEALAPRRRHLEVRFLVIEGFLDEAKVALVAISGGRASAEDERHDSFTLARRGIAFEETFPARARLRVAAFDARAGKGSWNAAAVAGAAFGGKLGAVDFSFSIKGVE